jgi:4-amino-4-deoxy-L-arabinose transferase-like glycosyltransferase
MTRSLRIKTFMGVLVLKALLFLFFVVQKEWPRDLTVPPLAITQLDTEWYFGPLDQMLQGEAYESVCKLPGFAPIYLPLRCVFEKETTYNLICVLQVMADVFATLCLSLFALRLTKNQRIFWMTVFLYSISTFVSIRSNYVLSDSFCTSFFIFGLYHLLKGTQEKNWRSILWAGIWLAWSFELRPVMLFVFPVALVLMAIKAQRKSLWFKHAFILLGPVVLLSVWWHQHVLYLHQRSLWLIAPVEECMTHYGVESAAIRRFIIATGHDFQPWSNGSAAEWFLKRNMELPAASPFAATDFAPAYNLDTLVRIRMDYKRIERGEDLRPEFGQQIIRRMEACTEAYKSHAPLRYYFTNRVGFLIQFLFPKRIDDLPLPVFDKMNILQKLVKIGSLLLLWTMHGCAIVSFFMILTTKQWNLFWWFGMGACSVIALAAIGFIEQRYLTASYPITVVYACIGLDHWIAWASARRLFRRIPSA